MPEAFLRWFPLLCLAGFVGTTLWRLRWLRRNTGVDAMAFETGDGAHAFLLRMFRVMVGLTGLYVVARAIWWRSLDAAVGRIDAVAAVTEAAGGVLQTLALAMMATGVLAMVAGQRTMGLSWRIGVDRDRPTDLVTSGLFRYSRNPIFAGVGAYFIALFLVSPTAPTLAIMAAGLVGMAVQVRLEEEHLGNLHGALYEDYRRRVRRWV